VSEPAFIEELTDQEVTEGDTVTLYARVEGQPFPELTWLVLETRVVKSNNTVTLYARVKGQPFPELTWLVLETLVLKAIIP